MTPSNDITDIADAGGGPLRRDRTLAEHDFHPMTRQLDPRAAADHPDHGQWFIVLWARYQHLVRCYREHDGLSFAILPEPEDEALLEMLSGRPGAHAMPEYLAIEGWLAMAYTAKAGHYAEPEARAHSMLAALVHERAVARYYCPTTCGSARPGCDHCQACEGGRHRLQALAAHQLGGFLAQAQFESHRELADR